MQQTYRGSCHCSRVTFELDAEIRYVIDCNCSKKPPMRSSLGSASSQPLDSGVGNRSCNPDTPE